MQDQLRVPRLKSFENDAKRTPSLKPTNHMPLVFEKNPPLIPHPVPHSSRPPSRFHPTVHSSTFQRHCPSSLFIVNICTLSWRNTARIASSQRIMRLSFGSCRSCARTYSQIFLTVWGRESVVSPARRAERGGERVYGFCWGR